MKSVPWYLFVPAKGLNEAYSDYLLPIGLNQTISQPYIVALITELLAAFISYYLKIRQ
jgi:protein-L-isoaspartate(D-aspartate) O-methyltransferase